MLLIITDGIISDMEATKEAIVYASTTPMSIIVVGVGAEDFAAMGALDADRGGMLRAKSGKVAERDIVQFVPLRSFYKPGTSPLAQQAQLAQAVLAEVPRQLTEYMASRSILVCSQRRYPYHLQPRPANRLPPIDPLTLSQPTQPAAPFDQQPQAPPADAFAQMSMNATTPQPPLYPTAQQYPTSAPAQPPTGYPSQPAQQQAQYTPYPQQQPTAGNFGGYPQMAPQQPQWSGAQTNQPQLSMYPPQSQWGNNAATITPQQQPQWGAATANQQPQWGAATANQQPQWNNGPVNPQWNGPQQPNYNNVPMPYSNQQPTPITPSAPPMK